MSVRDVAATVRQHAGRNDCRGAVLSAGDFRRVVFGGVSAGSRRSLFRGRARHEPQESDLDFRRSHLGGRSVLDAHGADMGSQSGQQPGLNQRRFPAAARSVDQSDRERLVGVPFFDLGFPEADAVGQSLAVARAGQQLQEEVGVVTVEGTQPLGDDGRSFFALIDNGRGTGRGCGSLGDV